MAGAAAVLMGQLDRLPIFALERDGALLNARWTDEPRRGSRQAGELELVHALRHLGGGRVHVIAQIPGCERTNELARLLDIPHTVLPAAGAEHHVMRTAA